MRLVTLARGAHGQGGALIGKEVLDFRAAAEFVPQAGVVPDQIAEILVAGSSAYRAATAAVSAVAEAEGAIQARLRASGALVPLDEVKLLAPIPRPRLVLAHGQAYHSHAQDWDRDAPRTQPTHPPAGFLKATSAITGSGLPIIIPKSAPDMVDYEGELALVFGRTCHNVKRAAAWDYVIGFTIINDVSARNWVPRRNAGAAPPIVLSALNMLFKDFPSFCPMGPNVTTKDELQGVTDFHLTTRLNGQIMQDSWTRDLIWDIPELIEFYSSIVVFEPGDVLSTGTPGGVGAGREPPVFMKPGDVCSVTVDGIGTLENTVVAEG